MSPIARAKLAFESVPAELQCNTSKLYSWGDFLPLDDLRGPDEGEFIGRLLTLFGERDDQEYVFRHRATGFVVTAYSAQSGPSFGGGSRCVREGDGTWKTEPLASQPPPDEETARAFFAQRIDWAKVDVANIAEPELTRLRTQEHAWRKRLADNGLPTELPLVVAELSALLLEVEPTEWEGLRYYSDAPSVYRVGVSDGEAFSDELPLGEALALLLRQAEEEEPPMKDTAGRGDDADLRVIEMWIAHVNDDDDDDDDDDDSPVFRSFLPRVQKAWFRYVKRLDGKDEDLVMMASETAVALEIDAEAVRRALLLEP